MQARSLACLTALFLLLAGSVEAQPRFDFERVATVLPKTVVPSRMQLHLDLDPAQPTFSGDLTVTLRVRQAVPAIVLHARDLQADEVTLTQGKGPARSLTVTADQKTWQWRLSPVDARPIAAGAYQLQIRYRGKVQSSGEGLFLVQHRAAGQPLRTLATQLQATSARQVFPGFDEPVFRASFELEVRAPAEYTVLSNMPLRGAPVAEGSLRRHRFAPTPSMPSYLLAVAVGQFDVLEGTSGATPLRIFTAPGKASQARVAMKATQDVLPYFASYFGLPYALPKLDQLAVAGVRQGAMEDWGLISYIEDALLFDESRSSPDRQRGVFSIVAHEIAHQWFGNLVSVASWDETWLNEAFATWMQKKASAHFHPEWQTRLYERMAVDGPFDRDATAATRAIRGGPVTESSVFEVFDDITYTKGGAVLTMLEQWVGPASFQRGLAAYMADRALRPATAGDLWHHIGRTAGLPVSKVAASWTDQKGLPLLQVESRCVKGQTLISLRQSRFALGEPLPAALWQLPVTLARGTVRRTVLMTGQTLTLKWPGCDAQPLLANADGTGYYRVDYDTASLARLTAAFVELAPIDRLTLLSDSYALTSAGRRPVADHLALLARVPQVQDASRAALFSQALRQWQQLDYAFAATPVHDSLRAAGRALFAPELAQLGWEERPGEDSETRRLRATLITRLATLGHAETLAAARPRFAAAMAADTSQVPRSIRGSVIRAVGRDPENAEFEALWDALQKTESQEERGLFLQALCSGADPVRAQRLLEESLSGRLPPDVSVDLVNAMGAVPALIPQVYAFAVENWQALARLGGDGPFGGRNWLLPGIAWWANDAQMAQRLLQDQQRLAGPTGASTAERVAASIEIRARLREREVSALAAALANSSLPK